MAEAVAALADHVAECSRWPPARHELVAVGGRWRRSIARRSTGWCGRTRIGAGSASTRTRPSLWSRVPRWVRPEVAAPPGSRPAQRRRTGCRRPRTRPLVTAHQDPPDPDGATDGTCVARGLRPWSVS